MLIVGELINASRKAVKEAIEAKDQAAIQKLAKAQAEAGADYIDVNAGVFIGQEAEHLKWLVGVVQEAVDKPCCLDSPDPKALEAALKVHQGRPLINSISLEKARLEVILPLLAGTDLQVIALCMSDSGMPTTAEQRLKVAEQLVGALVKSNVKPENIHVDPLVQPVATDIGFGVEFLKAIEAIKAGFSGVRTICGLSNISFGLPARKFLNQTFMVMAIERGLDGAILDPLDRRMMATIYAAETLAGKDFYCRRYLQAYRAGLIEK